MGLSDQLENETLYTKTELEIIRYIKNNPQSIIHMTMTIRSFSMKSSMAGRLTSEYLAEYASEIESFPLAAKGASEGNERCFLLLDGSFAPLGVTYVSDGEGVCSLMP